MILKKPAHGKHAVRFYPAGVLLEKTPLCLVPMNTCVVLQRTLQRMFGKEVPKIVYQTGRSLGLRDTAAARAPPSKQFEAVFERLRMYGMGNPEILSIREKEVLIKHDHSPFCEQCKKVFGTQAHPANPFLAGYYAGASTRILGKEFEGEEAECLAQKRQRCVFRITASAGGRSSPQEFPPVDFNWDIAEELDASIRSVITHHIDFENGEILIWKIYAAGLPVSCFIEQQKLLSERFGRKVQQAYFFIGQMQAKMGALMLLQRFGMEKDEKFVNHMICHLQFMGFGTTAIKESGPDRFVFHCRHSAFDAVSRAMYAAPVGNPYASGMIAGIMEAFFGEECAIIERALESGREIIAVRKSKTSPHEREEATQIEFNKKEMALLMGARNLLAARR